MAQNRELIVISKREEDLHFAREIGSAQGFTVSLVSAPPEGAKIARAAKIAPIVMIDIESDEEYAAFLSGFGDLLGETEGKISANHIHILSSDKLEHLTFFQDAQFIGNIVLRPKGDLKQAGEYYGQIVKNLCVNKGKISASSLLIDKEGDGSCDIIKIRHSHEKQKVLEKINDELVGQLQFSQRSASVITTAVDELIMNAIFDAPVDASGNQLYRNVARDTPLELGEKTKVEIQMAHRDDYIGVTVIDKFGSLSRKSIIKHLINAQREDYKLDENVHNAGLGLSTTFRSGGSLLFQAKRGEHTAATTLFKRADRYQDFRGQFRFVSIHIGEGEPLI